MKSSKKLFLYFFLIVFYTVSAQEHLTENIDGLLPLKEILTSLETKYNVRFSFDSDLIEKFNVPPLNKEEELSTSLLFLEKETNLVFEKLDSRYIVVKQKEPKTNLSVCGYLVDEFTGNPIPNATVWIAQKSLGTSSDKEGYFELKKLSSDWLIRIDYLGYNSLESPVFKLVKENCGKIVLSEKKEILEEVLISDYLTTGMSKQKDGAVRVSPNRLGILPGLTEPDVLQSLQLLPGVQSPGETAADLHVRGGTPDQNLVLFDGIKMYESGHFFGLISSFNPYVTKNIEFYRSGTSAKYGDRIGGVLDVTSGDAVPELKGGFGLNLLHADAYIKAPLLNNKVGVIFSARRSLTDFWNTVTYRSFSESVFQNTRIAGNETVDSNDLTNVENSFFFHDYNLKVIADVSEKDKLIFSNLYNKNDLEYYSENDRFNEKNTDELSIKNLGSNFKWTRTWNDKWSHKIDLNHSSYELDYDGIREITRRNPENSRTVTFQKDNKVDDIGFKAELQNRMNDTSVWSHGYEYSKNEVSYFYENTGVDGEGGNQAIESEVTNNATHAFYTEYSYKSSHNWNVNVGVRGNYFSVVEKFYLEPRVYVSNWISDTFQLKMSAEIKNQVLSQLIEFRNSGLSLENEIWALSEGNDIPVLNNYQVTGGFLFQKNGWNLDVDFYNKVINGLTILTEDVTNGAPEYISGKSTTNGMDVLLKKKFGNYRSWISYTLSKTRFLYEDLNEGLSFDGEYDIPHSFVWSHTYGIKNYEFSLGLKLRSGTPYTKAIGVEEIPGRNGAYVVVYEDEVNSNRLPLYKKADFSATYKFNFSKSGAVKGKFGISLLNIFDTENILDRSYEVKTESVTPGPENPTTGTLIEIDQISIGFTPNLVFRVDF